MKHSMTSLWKYISSLLPLAVDDTKAIPTEEAWLNLVERLRSNCSGRDSASSGGLAEHSFFFDRPLSIHLYSPLERTMIMGSIYAAQEKAA